MSVRSVGLDQVINVNVKVIVVLDVVHGGLGGNLVNDQPRPLHAFVGDVLHLLPHQTLRLLSGFPVRRQQVFVF